MKNNSNSCLIEKVTTVEDCNDVRSEWDELRRDMRSYGLYLSYDWFKLWLERFGGKECVMIFLVYRKHSLRCIAPTITKDRLFKGVWVRCIELVGNVYSPVRSFILDLSNSEECVSVLSDLFNHLRNTISEWDMIDLSCLPPDVFHIYTKALARAKLTYEEYFCYGNWYEDQIECSWDEYITSRGSSIKRNFFRNRRKLEKLGDLEFRMITKPDSIDHYINMYLKVYAKSWKEGEALGPKFIADLMRMAAEKGWLRLGFLLFDGDPIAVGFALVDDGIAYFPKSAYDPRFTKFGVGAMWLGEMMKHYIDIDKVHTIDLLMGDEPYKRDWVSKRRERRGVLVFNRNMKGRLLGFMMKDVVPIVRRVKYIDSIKRYVQKKMEQS